MFSFGFGVPSNPAPAAAPAFGVNGFQISATNYKWVHTLAANPTTRPDGSPLVNGDRIFDPITSEPEWWWNGTLWLSEDFQAHSFINSVVNNAAFTTIFDCPPGRGMLIKEAIYSFIPSGTVTTTPTLTIVTGVRTLGAASTLLFNNPILTGTVLTNTVRASLKQSVGVTIPKTVVAAASGVALNMTQTLGLTLTSFSFGLRWAFVR